MSFNPFTPPPNVFEQLELLWRARDAALLIQYPWCRRNTPGYNGSPFTVDLGVLAGIPEFVPSASPTEAARQAARISEIQDQLAAGQGYPPLVLQIADGATVPDAPVGDIELRLEAYRNSAIGRVPVRLFWPRIRYDLWNFFRVINGNDPVAIDAAFRGE